MEIRINAMRLRNFKGVRQAEYHFGGRNARIEGPNGSGKSTVFDAFTWLLFGKDHRDQTDKTFEIKTIDPETGSPYPREDHWVEAVLTVDGQDHVLRRAWVENWVKPTGEIEDVLKGHKTMFYVDGVDVGTKTAYDAVVAGWLREDSFKLLTNPHYFIDDSFTGWKDRRAALLDLVKDDPGRERVRKEFEDVVNRLSGRSIEDYRKRLVMEKNANKKDLAQTLSRIDGMRDALPEDVDGNAIHNQLEAEKVKRDRYVSALKEQAEALDQQIASADRADEARKAENGAIWAEITKVQLEQNKLLVEAKKVAQERNNERDVAVMDAQHTVEAAENKMRATKAQADRTRGELAEAEKERGRLAAELGALGDQYRAEKVKAFEYTPDTKCPYCGQEMPAATVAEAQEKAQQAWNAERRATLERIIGKAQRTKDDIAKLDERIKDMQGAIEKATQENEQAASEAASWREWKRKAEAQPVVDLMETEAVVKAGGAWKALAAKEQKLRAQALSTGARAEGTEGLVKQRAALEQQIREAMEAYAREEVAAKEKLAVSKVRAEQQELIRKEERRAKQFADAVAACEREEARAAEYVKADIDSVDAALNGLFTTARWKMFDRTMDGGVVEMCDVTSPDGVPYRSMNDAMKILCGLDVIRVFSERYGSRAPIFIDNAEGILRESFDTGAQVIRLVVKDTPELTLVTE